LKRRFVLRGRKGAEGIERKKDAEELEDRNSGKLRASPESHFFGKGKKNGEEKKGGSLSANKGTITKPDGWEKDEVS